MATRIVIIGGFLGSGKTTIINRLARALNRSGKNIAMITNDQGGALVDTQYCAAQGMEVAEVQRGCFCCRFDEFMLSARSLVGRTSPDMILAEPVGSCTDLLATVVAPLKILYPHEFTVAPLIILVDAERAVEAGFNSESIGDYLRRHQIQEGEVVVLSKMDKVTGEELEQVRDVIGEMNPSAEIVPYSTFTDRGLEHLLGVIMSDRVSGRTPVQIDYDVYARAEAELGWYNGVYHFHAHRADSYDLATRVLRGIAAQYQPDDIAHAKVMLHSETNAVKISAVLRSITVDAVKGSRYSEGNVTMTVNARIVSSPEDLQEAVRKSVQKAMEQTGLSLEGFEDECFSPSRPNPTHRMV
jgi:G3E family GTPase